MLVVVRPWAYRCNRDVKIYPVVGWEDGNGGKKTYGALMAFLTPVTDLVLALVVALQWSIPVSKQILSLYKGCSERVINPRSSSNSSRLRFRS